MTKPKNSISMAAVLRKEVTPVAIDLPDDQLEFTDGVAGTESESTIAVDFVDVDAIEIAEIHDTHGRLSDVIETFEDILHLSAIPLSLARIAPEVVDLKRHEIFEFGDERYAFSHRIRKDVVKDYLENISSNISTGLPFELELCTNISYEDKIYPTFQLSRDEWTYVLSKFRNYKQELVTDNSTSIVLRVFAERV